MNILIIEDEPLAAEKLSRYILRYSPQAKIQGPLDKVEEVKVFFNKNRPLDLIFSDIELLDGSVFQSLNELDLPCPVIFITAYDNYWMQAFQNMGIEYLLKPFSYKRFIESMIAFEQLKVAFSKKCSTKIDTKNSDYKRRLLLKKRKSMEVLDVEDIICLRASKGIIIAYDKRGLSHILIQNSVTDLESQLNPQDFFRISRSDIINIKYIQRFENYGKDTLAIYLLNIDEPLISSKTKSSKFRRWLTT
ncbi:LytTR family DNA-binding domain-containing protein [Microbulbifer sp. GL-2]|uniref:LytR/AlgR family response regulator transcription factor n=1 Tax=Microbulbifer sp. GL-2 TaxID=2591606 RepID=UPI0011658246|nr:LytTR family DNA-binding domain-containing protein [Microbulbifer sp. GL-2]BBM03713.1 DNA-binding response regulator [Microbulbifer sp. GL-2]